MKRPLDNPRHEQFAHEMVPHMIAETYGYKISSFIYGCQLSDAEVMKLIDRIAHLTQLERAKDVNAAGVRWLRETTGQGLVACKNALIEAGGNYEKALEVLQR